MDHTIQLQVRVGLVNCCPYCYSYLQKNELECLNQEQFDAKLICPSNSPYSSLALLVKKEDGGWRFYIDYHALNAITIPNRFPIPIVDELLEELYSMLVFSKLDLKSGYLRYKCKKRTANMAFHTHQGHYEYVVMPFGLSNTLATFQAVMNDIFRPHL